MDMIITSFLILLSSVIANVVVQIPGCANTGGQVGSGVPGVGSGIVSCIMGQDSNTLTSGAQYGKNVQSVQGGLVNQGGQGSGCVTMEGSDANGCIGREYGTSQQGQLQFGTAQQGTTYDYQQQPVQLQQVVQAQQPVQTQQVPQTQQPVQLQQQAQAQAQQQAQTQQMQYNECTEKQIEEAMKNESVRQKHMDQYCSAVCNAQQNAMSQYTGGQGHQQIGAQQQHIQTPGQQSGSSQNEECDPEFIFYDANGNKFYGLTPDNPNYKNQKSGWLMMILPFKEEIQEKATTSTGVSQQCVPVNPSISGATGC